MLRESENEHRPEDQVSATRDLVLAFVDALGTARAAVRMSVPSLHRLADLLALARSGEISRRGEVGGYSYAVHGAGCRPAGPDGIDIDVDFTADGTEIFDFWRLRLFGRSRPTPVDPTPKDLRSAVEALDDVLTEVGPGWFTVSGTPQDAVEGRAVHSDPA